MLKITTPKRPINGQTLYEELVLAGVRLRPMLPFSPISLDGKTLAIEIERDEDEATARAVVAAHVPPPEPTPAQIKRQQARKLIEFDDSPESVRLRALVRVLYASLVETRAWNNAMRLYQLDPINNPLPKPLINRNWEAAEQAVLMQIDADTSEV